METKDLDFILGLVGKRVRIKIDRSLGSFHPKFGYEYPLNYGYVEGLISGDGEFIDAYIIGEEKSLVEYLGEVKAVIHRLDDNDDKLILAKEEIKLDFDIIKNSVMFQEKYFNSVLYINGEKIEFNKI